ncbi:MAG: methyltransferase [Lentisphaerae bacterium GWF2_45_14]|nr:MAG: methyltransferase [Lentisphaerae bacterium GWF2_45_14]
MKLHLGCGKRYLPGFVHIDINPFEHVDHVTPIDCLDMIEDGAAELIYASHCFEYFDRVEAVRVLSEWRRVLKSGGILRLAVPSFEELLEVYRATGELDRLIGPIFGRWELKNGTCIYHKTVYDRKSLKSLLESNGFRDTTEWDWRRELPTGYDDYSRAYYPHMDLDNGICTSLNMQALKA